MPAQHHHTYKMLDHTGRMRHVVVIHEPAEGGYVGTIRDSEQQPIIACGIDDTPRVAAVCCIQNLQDRAFDLADTNR